MRQTSIGPSTSDAKTKTMQSPQIQTSLAESFTKGIAYEKSSKRWKEITRAITMYICKDMIPVYTVEKKGFRDLIKTLDPRYVIPSRKHFSEVELPRLYGECRGKLEQELGNVLYFATTTDLWTSRTTQPYMSLTIHFINDWTLCSRCLQTSYFPEDHTGEMIAQSLKEALQSWGLLEERQVCVTTDNATNNIKALQLNDWTRLQCFGHRLHLAIERGVKVPQVDRAVGVCKRVVLKPQDDDTQLTKDIKVRILNYLNEKYADQSTQELLDMASLLDPRFKTTYIEAERVDYMKVKAAAEMESLAAEQSKSAEGASLPPVEAAEEIPAKKKKKSLGSFFKIKSRKCQADPQSERESIEMELNSYLQTVEVDGETNPLEWWRQHEAYFPRVASLAKKYLCIPATSAPSERAFSTSRSQERIHLKLRPATPRAPAGYR
ncbi:unnamed protein product [Leuciscus chuanchicus]